MKMLDMFAGWGGATLGAQMARTPSGSPIETLLALNHDPAAVQGHAANHPDVIHRCQDVNLADFAAMPAVDALWVSASCQGHSTSSQPRRRSYHDPMRATVFAALDCADITRPAAVILENVTGIRRWALWPTLLDGFARLGYRIDVRVLDAARHGVPQRRTRLFLLATLDDAAVGDIPQHDELAFEPYLHHDDDIPGEAWRIVADGTDGVKARVGRGRERHGDRFLVQWVTGHSGIPLHEPLRTVTTAANHWNLVDGDRYRALTSRELARAQGFPDSYQYPDDAPETVRVRLAGNAVPPPLSAAVLTAVAAAVA